MLPRAPLGRIVNDLCFLPDNDFFNLVYTGLHFNIGRVSKVTPPPWYKGWGGGMGDGTPPWVFAIFQ